MHSALKKPPLVPPSPQVHLAIDDLMPDDSYEDDLRLQQANPTFNPYHQKPKKQLKPKKNSTSQNKDPAQERKSQAYFGEETHENRYDEKLFVGKPHNVSDKIGAFRRLHIDRDEYLLLPKELREDYLKKQIISDVRPAQLRKLIKRQDMMNIKTVNALNDIEQHFDKIPDYGSAFYVMDPSKSAARSKILEDLAKEAEEKRKILGDERPPWLPPEKTEEEKEQIRLEAKALLKSRLEKRQEHYEKMARKVPSEAMKYKLRQGIIWRLLTILLIPEGNVLFKQDMKVSSQPKALQDRQEKQKYEIMLESIAKLKELKKKIEDDRKREEQELNKRLYDQSTVQGQMRVIGRPMERIATSVEDFQLPDVGNAHAHRTRNGGVQYQPLTSKSSQQLNLSKKLTKLSFMPSTSKISETNSKRAYVSMDNKQPQDGGDEDLVNYDTSMQQEIGQLPKAPKLRLRKLGEIQKTTQSLDKVSSQDEDGHSSTSSDEIVRRLNLRQQLLEVEDAKERRKLARPQQRIKKYHIYDNDVIIIRPNLDASNKQIFAKNQFQSNAERILFAMEKNSQQAYVDNVFRPERFGEFSRPLEGHMFLKDETYSKKPADFHLQYLLKTKQERKAEKQRKKRDRQLKKDIVVRDSIAPPIYEEEHPKGLKGKQPEDLDILKPKRKNKAIMRQTQTAFLVDQILKEKPNQSGLIYQSSQQQMSSILSGDEDEDAIAKQKAAKKKKQQLGMSTTSASLLLGGSLITPAHTYMILNQLKKDYKEGGGGGDDPLRPIRDAAKKELVKDKLALEDGIRGIIWDQMNDQRGRNDAFYQSKKKHRTQNPNSPERKKIILEEEPVKKMVQVAEKIEAGDDVGVKRNKLAQIDEENKIVIEANKAKRQALRKLEDDVRHLKAMTVPVSELVSPREERMRDRYEIKFDINKKKKK
ncbi:hypothetical protein FGO68_gene10637 [Halteria grandinella]|uniref:Uncharacterized protein n=1 Tax=Halteria grandinella TaxID=5974 RepID=A0A8J8P5Z0_HALGN|nr:hypothetical protein FGO68_gene10637 [Halteria grandinella]